MYNLFRLHSFTRTNKKKIGNKREIALTTFIEVMVLILLHLMLTPIKSDK